MKKVTKSREFDSIKENQPIESSYNKPEKHSLIKSFTQSANQNIGKAKIQENEKKDKQYAEKPAEDIKGAKEEKSMMDNSKGRYVKIKKSSGNFVPLKKGGKKKFESEKEFAGEAEKCGDIELSKKPKLGTGKRFEQLVSELKKKSIEEGITDSPIVKSLIDISPLDVNDEEIDELEKAYDVKDPTALAAWIGRKKYGKKKYQELSAAGKKKEKSKKEEIEEIAEDVKGPELKVDEAMKKVPKDKQDDVLRELRESKKKKGCMRAPKMTKAMNSNNGSGGDLIAPQLAGQKKKLVKVKKSTDTQSFFVQSDCQKA